MASLDDLRSILLRHASEGLHSTAVPGLSFLRRDNPTRPVANVYDPLLCLVVAGSKQITLGAVTRQYRAGDMVLAAVEIPTVAEVTDASPIHPFLAASISIDTGLVANIVATIDASEHQLSNSVSTVGGLGKAEADAPTIDAFARLAGLLDDTANIPVLAPLIEREIIFRLLCGRLGAHLQTCQPTEPGMRSLRQTAAAIKTNPAKLIRVNDLATAAGMSAATFYRRFKKVTSLSPLQFQKRVRLHDARRRLVVDGEGVAQAAYAVGYESASQFSRDYRRLFRDTPTRDVAANRAGNGGY